MSPQTNTKINSILHAFFFGLLLAIVFYSCSAISGCNQTLGAEQQQQRMAETIRQQRLQRIRERCQELESEYGSMLIWCHEENISDASRTAACRFTEEYSSNCAE